MKHRNKYGRFRNPPVWRRREAVGLSIIAGIVLGIFIDVAVTQSTTIEYVKEAHAQEIVEERPIVLLEEKIEWTRERIDQEIEKWAEEYGVSASTMKKVVECESRYYVKAHNTADPHGGAHGLAQFLPPTFKAYAPRAGIGTPDIWNPTHQLKTMAYMFSLGEIGKNQWTCYRMLK